MEGNQRFLLVTWDGAGNLTPELSLARELVRRGHSVDVLGQDSLRKRIESAGCRFIPLKTARQWDTAKEEPDDPASFYMANCVFAQAYADDTGSALRSASYNALLVDAFLTYAIAAALAARIPTAVLVHSLYEMFDSSPFADFFDAELRKVSAEIEQLGIGPFDRFKDLIEAANDVLVFSFATFDRTSAGVTHVGPLRSVARTSDWSRQFVGRPLVVVGLSTAYQSQGPVLQRICNALGSLDVEAVVTTGPAIEPSSLEAPENVTVVQYMAHDEVLPESDLLITHAGHGTTMAGVQYGVPMMCMPVGADQPLVAGRVVELGLGSIIDKDSSEREISQAIRAMLDDRSMRMACDRFAESLVTHPGMKQAIDIVEAL